MQLTGALRSMPSRGNTPLASDAPEPFVGRLTPRRNVKPPAFATATIASSTKPTATSAG